MKVRPSVKTHVALPADDHVARLRAHDIEARPEWLEELLAEIGMSRALLEG